MVFWWYYADADQSTIAVLWWAHLWLGHIYGPDHCADTAVHGQEEPHHPLHHTPAVLRDLCYVWSVSLILYALCLAVCVFLSVCVSLSVCACPSSSVARHFQLVEDTAVCVHSYLSICCLCVSVPPLKSWGLPDVEWEGGMCSHSHTCTYCQTYKCSVTHHAGSCTLTLGISVMEFVMPWRLLQLKVILTRDS